MTISAFQTYERRVPYSGRVPQKEAAGSQWAQAQATESFGSSIARTGRAVTVLGGAFEENRKEKEQAEAERQDKLEREKIRESAVNELAAETEIERQHRTFLKEMPDRQWVEDGTGNWSASIDESRQARQRLIDATVPKLHPDRAQLWKARMEAQDLNREEAVIQKQSELREQYISQAVPTAIANAGRAGDIKTAEQWDLQFQGLYADSYEEQEWKDLQLLTRQKIILGYAYTDPEEAFKLVDKWIPESGRAKFTAELERDISAAAAQKEYATKTQREANDRSVYANMHTFSATNGQEGKMYQPSQLAHMYETGYITKTTFDAGIAMSMKPERKTDMEADTRAVQAIRDFQTGTMTKARAQDIIRAETPNISDERLQTLNAKLDSEYDAMRSRGLSQAGYVIKEILSPQQPEIDRLGYDKDVAALAVKAAALQLERSLEVVGQDATRLSRKDIVDLGSELALDIADNLKGLSGSPDSQRAVLLNIIGSDYKEQPQAETERKKGPGFLGTLARPDGDTSTELSIGVELDGREIEIPSLVPTLTKTEVDHMLSGKKPTKAIVDKAVEHAKKRMAEGKDVFAQPGEQTRAATKVPDGMIRLIAPDNKPYAVRPDQVDEAIRHGWRKE
jgi:hypothetical protein